MVDAVTQVVVVDTDVGAVAAVEAWTGEVVSNKLIIRVQEGAVVDTVVQHVAGDTIGVGTADVSLWALLAFVERYEIRATTTVQLHTPRRQILQHRQLKTIIKKHGICAFGMRFFC